MSVIPIEFVVPYRVRINDLRSTLKIQFPVQEEKRIVVDRNYLDTFDWRLYGNQYEFFTEIQQHHESLVLNLVSRAGQEDDGFTMFQKAAPVFAEDVENASLRRRLLALISIRALILWTSVRITRHTLRYLDKDGKTRLYIYIEDCWHRINGKKHKLDKRIRLQPVKGYSAPLATVSRFLRKDFQLENAEQTLFEKGLAAINVVQGAYSSRLDSQLDGDMRTDMALKKILLFSLDIIESNEPGTIEDIDSEFLHDFRVAVRRTRSVLSQVKQVFPQTVLQRFEPGFKWLGSITGPTRDMHVYRLKFDSYQKCLPSDMRIHLEPLRIFIEKHQRIEHAKLVKALRTRRYQTLLKSWRDFLQEPVPQRTVLANAAQPVKQTADEHIWKAYRKVIKQGKAVRKKSPDETLHKLRITCKKLRYFLEFFQSLYPPRKLNSLIKSLKQLQDVLGDFQDLSVQVDSLNHMQEQMRDEGLMTEETHRAMDLLAQYFYDQKHCLRETFATRFALFSNEKNMKRFQVLFKPFGVKA